MQGFIAQAILLMGAIRVIVLIDDFKSYHCLMIVDFSTHE